LTGFRNQLEEVVVMLVEDTPLDGVKVITPSRFGDQRGFFSEIWNSQVMEAWGLNYDFVQDNQSISEKAGTVRGLHFQLPPHAQDKLVRCGRGALWDVAVDIRVGSPSFRRWFGVELSAENGKQLLVPKGFLHGFVTLQPDTEILYKCSDYYSPECDQTVRFDDPDIGVDWDIDPSSAILSEKDANAPFLRDIQSPFTYEQPAQ
jgi:dTDP-4-dehydrorhamnose 3,5-epimerase